MDKKDLISTLYFDERESKIFMPNEIFDDLRENIDSSSSHIAFAYSFYYLITWLYRYCKYTNEILSRRKLKQILGYSAMNKTLNYLIKKDGVLDSLGYTRTITDFPVIWSLDEFNTPDFEMFSETDEEIKPYMATNTRNQSIKMPVKALFREEWAEQDNYYNGTFYEVENTHMIPFQVFIECMGNKELGCVAFYLYAFFSHKNDLYQNGFDISLDKLSRVCNIKSSTRDKYLANLKEYNLIKCLPTNFITGLPDGFTQKASRYKTNHFSFFSEIPVEYEKRRVMSWETVKDYYEEV